MVEKFREITNEMADLYERKNSDYGDSVHDTYVKYGPVSFLVRMEDKLNRARTLIQKGDQKVNDEKVRDTLIDLANYSILMVLEMEREKTMDVTLYTDKMIWKDQEVYISGWSKSSTPDYEYEGE